MNAQRKRLRFRPGIVLLRLLDGVVIAIVAVLLFVWLVGVPDWIVRRILEPDADDAYALEAAMVTFDPFQGGVLSDVRLFRRMTIGPPIAEARRVVVTFDLRSLLRGHPHLDRLAVESGVVRLNMLAPREAESRPTQPPFAMDVSLKNMVLEGIKVNEAEGRLQITTQGWQFANLQAVIEREDVRATMTGRAESDADGEYRLEGSVEGDPHVFVPLLESMHWRTMLKILSRFSFPSTPPRWDLTVHRRPGAGAATEVASRFWFEDFRLKDVPVIRADGRVKVTQALGRTDARVDPFVLVRDEGMARGSIRVGASSNACLIAFEGTSGLSPHAIARMIGLSETGALGRFRFTEPYRVQAEGELDIRRPQSLRMDATAAVGGLGYGRYEAENVSARIRVRDATNRFDGVQATWYGGDLTGRIEYVEAPPSSATNSRFRSSLTLSDANFEQVAHYVLHAGTHDYAGRLSGNLVLEGQGGEQAEATYRGHGNINISKGRIFQLPIFGGLSEYLSKMIPGLDVVLRQSDAKAKFTIGNGGLYSDHIQVEGDVLSLEGKGRYSFNGDLDFAVRLTFLKSHTFVGKIIRIPTYLISKLFEFRLTGTRDKPKWYPVNFSKDLWKREGIDGVKTERSRLDGTDDWDADW